MLPEFYINVLQDFCHKLIILPPNRRFWKVVVKHSHDHSFRHLKERRKGQNISLADLEGFILAIGLSLLQLLEIDHSILPV